MTRDEYVSTCNKVPPGPSDIEINSFDENGAHIETIGSKEFAHDQNNKRLDWRKKFNERCKSFSISKLRPPTRKPHIVSLPSVSPQMLHSDTFFQFPKWPK